MAWHWQEQSWRGREGNWWNAGRNASPAKTQRGSTHDKGPWGERYTYFNGPQRQAHTVPIEDRIHVIRGAVEQSQATDHGADPLKLPLFKTLSWPADVVDSVIFLITGLARRTPLRSLGDTQEEVAATMAEAFRSRMPNPMEHFELIERIIDHADNHMYLVESALEGGFQLGTPAQSFESRARMFVTGSLAHGASHVIVTTHGTSGMQHAGQERYR